MPDQDDQSTTGGAGTAGWDAIERAVAAQHPDVEPLHWGTGATLPGAGVNGLSAYRAADHWLFVTFGLTELFDKTSADQRVSGWGFELTMRTPVGVTADELARMKPDRTHVVLDQMRQGAPRTESRNSVRFY